MRAAERQRQRAVAWAAVTKARHPDRPYALDLAEIIFSDFFELRGDRTHGDDPALVGGMALLEGRTVMLVAQQKGRTQEERIRRNFGMPHPEGYRKARRLVAQAGRHGIPVVCLVDTPGAYPGRQAEERGQAWAIAECLRELLTVPVPTISVILGEGGSGGALALAATDRVLMLEHSVYSVASPEACASILFRDSGEAPRAAAALRLTAQDALRLGLADSLVSEPGAGAHEQQEAVALSLRRVIHDTILELSRLNPEQLCAARYLRYRSLGSI
ncbi:MAG: acetyl-CoA carboxylase carboxyltransferase subunit alpha [Candidatus Dormibacteria bacterium]